jgi:hypothetical protein
LLQLCIGCCGREAYLGAGLALGLELRLPLLQLCIGCCGREANLGAGLAIGLELGLLTRLPFPCPLPLLAVVTRVFIGKPILRHVFGTVTTKVAILFFFIVAFLILFADSTLATAPGVITITATGVITITAPGVITIPAPGHPAEHRVRRIIRSIIIIFAI